MSLIRPKACLFLAILAVLLLAPAAGLRAQSFSADDFLPPAQSDDPAKLREVQDPAEVKSGTSDLTGAPAVEAKTPQDAINAFIEQSATGFAEIRFPSGFGYAAKGVASYGSHANPVAAKIDQRNAYNIAYINAKTALAEGLGGLSNEGKSKLADSLTNIDSSEQSLSEFKTSATESIDQVISKVLRGYVVYDVRDDFEKHVVNVTIVATPKTMGYIERPDPSTIVAESVREGLNEILAEIKRNIVPPVGGRTVFVQATGEFAYVGFGSDVIRQDADPALQAKQALNSQKVAAIRANDALCGLIVGDSVNSRSSLSSDIATLATNFEKASASDPLKAADYSEGYQALQERRREFLSVQTNSTLTTNLRKGVLPPGVQTSGWIDDDNAFAYSVAVWLPSASERARQAGDLMDGANILGGGPSSSSSAGGGDGKPLGTPLKPGPSGQVQSPDDL
jgi:hypothetical protein